jgi:2',3'-cyclic-nucleotide 2'-phosphodiesterase (5'-nucleotidase family)
MKRLKYSTNITKMRRSVIYATAIVFLMFGCSTNRSVTTKSARSPEIVFKFIQLNDVYEIAPLSGGQYGGLARVAHVRDSVAKVNPNTYLFMAGDFLNPSLLGTLKVDGERVNGKHVVEVMNAMNFDLVTFGNHEFDVGEEALQKRINESNFLWTSANVRQITANGKQPFHIQNDFGNIPIPDTQTFEVVDTHGTKVKVGFFSVTTPVNPVDFVAYGDIYLEANRAYNSLVNTVDIVVGLTHLTIEEDKKLAKSLPNLRFIMGGHEHNSMLVEAGDAVIAKADANAKSLYIHTVSYNTITKDLQIDSHLMPIDNRTASKPDVEKIVSKWGSILDKKIKEVIEDPNEVIYKSDIPLDGTDSANRGIQTNLGDLLTASMAFSFNERVDGAVLNGGSIRIDDMLPNEVTSLDIFRVLPFGGNVIRVEMTGRLLIDILDFGKSQGGTGAYLQRHNIIESDIAGWMINRNPIRVKETYTIAMTDFLLKGYDIPFLTKDNPGILKVHQPLSTEPASDIRKAVIMYLKSLIPQNK